MTNVKLPTCLRKEKEGKLVSSNLLESLNEKRKNNVNVDVDIPCGNVKFSAHKLVLIAGCPYFRTIFSDENTQTVFEIGNFSKKCWEILLEFIYIGLPPREDVTKDEKLLKEIISAAGKLKLDNLLRFCVHRLADNLSNTDLDQLVKLNAKYIDETDPCSVLSHATLKFGHFYNRSDFLKLKLDDVKSILKDPSINKAEMDDVLGVIIHWVKYDVQNREGDVETLLSLLDLGYLSFNCLVTLLRSTSCFLAKCRCICSGFGKDSLSKLKQLLIDEFTARRDTPNLMPKVIDKGYEHTLFCFCTKGEQHVERYNVNTNQWISTTQLPDDFPLHKGMAIVAHSNFIYLLGGQISDTENSSKVFKFCPITNRIVSEGKLSYPVQKASGWVVNGLIYVLDEGENRRKSYKVRIQCYNPVNRTSEPLIPKKTQTRTYRKESIVYDVVLRHNFSAYSVTERRQSAPVMIKALICPPSEVKVCSWFKETITNQQTEGYINPAKKKTNEDWQLFDFNWDIFPAQDMLELDQCVQEKKWLARKFDEQVLLTQDEASVIHTYNLTKSRWVSISECNSGLYIISHAVVLMEPFIQFQEASDLQKQHQDQVLLALYNAQQNSLLTDCTLKCGGGQVFEGHKLVLSTVSPYFEALFHGGLRESVSGICPMPEVSAPVMETILLFLYTERLVEDGLHDTNGRLAVNFMLSFQQHWEALQATHMRGIRKLFVMCLSSLLNLLSIDNCNKLKPAAIYCSEGLLERIQAFYITRLREWTNSSKFKKLSVAEILRTLQHPEMESVSLIDIVNSLLKWVGHDHQNRDKEFEMLLANLNAHTANDDELKQVHEAVKKCRQLKENKKIQRIMDGWWMVFGRPKMYGSKIVLSKTENSGTDVQVIDVETGRNLIDREFPFSVVTGISVGYGNDVYFFKRMLDEASNETSQDQCTEVIRFCPYRNEIVSTIPFKFDVHIQGASGLDGCLYVVGEKKSRNRSNLIVQSCSFGYNECRRVKSPVQICEAKNVHAWKGSLYVVGGFGDANPNSSVILEKYDPVFDEWSTVAEAPCLSNACATAFFEGKLFLLSRQLESNDNQKLYVFDFVTNKWAVQLLCKLSYNTDRILVFQKNGQLQLWVIDDKKMVTDIGSTQVHREQQQYGTVVKHIQNAIKDDGFDLVAVTC